MIGLRARKYSLRVSIKLHALFTTVPFKPFSIDQNKEEIVVFLNITSVELSLIVYAAAEIHKSLLQGNLN